MAIARIRNPTLYVTTLGVALACLMGFSLFKSLDNPMTAKTQAQSTEKLDITLGPHKILSSHSPLALGQQAPEFQLPVLQISPGADVPPLTKQFPAQLIERSAYTGVVLYLVFWDSFCAPCRRSLPELDVIRKRYPRTELEIIAINLDTDLQQALGFLGQTPVSFPILADVGAQVAQRYGVSALPMSFAIDRQGYVRGKQLGYKDADSTAIEHKLLALMADEGEGA